MTKAPSTLTQYRIGWPGCRCCQLRLGICAPPTSPLARPVTTSRPSDLFDRDVMRRACRPRCPGIHREHVEAFIEHLLATYKPATAANRYAGLRAFFNWAVDEGGDQGKPDG